MNRILLLAASLMVSFVAAALRGTTAGAVPAGPAANVVWGQPTFLTGRCLRAGSGSLCGPSQALTDAQGNLWVADLAENRVLMYRPGSTTASKVFGQYGSFTTRGCDQRPPRGRGFPAAPSRYTLCQPAGVAVDRNGTLYIADSIDNRILIYFHAAEKPASAPADLVLGQANFRATASNDTPAGGKGRFRCSAPRPASRCSLNSPMELSLDTHGNLLVPDLDNHRVLLWSAATLAHFRPRACARRCFIPASRVWGQYGSFTSRLSNNPAIPAGTSPRCTPITPVTPASPCTLSGPWSAAADARGDLFVADTNNNRVLEFDQAVATGRQDATTVYGQEGSFATRFSNTGGLSSSSLWHPLGLALDPAGNLWVADFYNMRILQFPAPGSAGSIDAIGVLGQHGQFSTRICGLGAGAICGPVAITFDPAGHGFVADGLNNRVLEFFSPG